MNFRISILVFAIAIGSATAHAGATLVSDLGWLAGNWVGTLDGGALYESHYSDPGGGVIVGASKETRNGRTVGTDFEIISEQDGRVIYQPHPNGVKSPHSFPLVAYDALARRAVFENRDNDFPQVFTLEQPSMDELRITLEGLGKDGAAKRIVFDLHRAL